MKAGRIIEVLKKVTDRLDKAAQMQLQTANEAARIKREVMRLIEILEGTDEVCKSEES